MYIDVVDFAAMIAVVLKATTSTWLAALRRYIVEKVLSHYKSSKSICKGIDTVAGLRVTVSIWPDDIEAGVYVRHCKVMECRMRQC